MEKQTMQRKNTIWTHTGILIQNFYDSGHNYNEIIQKTSSALTNLLFLCSLWRIQSVIKPSPLKRERYAMAMFICLSVRLSVRLFSLRLSPRPRSKRRDRVAAEIAAERTLSTVSQKFLPPWKTPLLCEICASGMGLLVASVNAPHLLILR